MSAIKLHAELNSLLEKNQKQKKKRNKKARQLQIQHEKELLQFLNDSEWKPLILGDPSIQMDKAEVKTLTNQLYAHSSSLRALYDRSQLLMDIIKYGNSSFNWKVAVPAPVYLMPRHVPLLNEYDFIELAAFRRLEIRFEASLQQLDELSIEERAGQILFSAILHGALFSTWKQIAFMQADREQWVVESFASWVELKVIKHSSKKKPEEELCHEDYKTARWFPDPLTEMLIFRWFDDFKDQICLIGIRRIKSLLFLFLKRIGILKEEQPSSLAAFTRWSSHAVALEIPPYMHNIAYDKPEATYLSAECWLRMYAGKKVLRYDSATPNKDEKVALKYATQYCGALVPLTIQSTYLERITNDLTNPKITRKVVVVNLMNQINNGSGDSPSFISWLIAAFVLEILQHGGQVKETLTLSTIGRYLGAINAPLLNAFADVDACLLSESQWLSHLQGAIDNSDDQMTRNRIAEFAAFIQQFDEVADFDICELEGASINNRVDANLVTHHEFNEALSRIKYGGRLERMQRIAGALGFYLGLRSGETTHILLKDIAGESDPELLVRSNRYYGTKNRTSRRLPLAILLPAPLFYEFMQFYHERIEDEGKKLGNKLLFSYAGNSTSPLSYKEFIKPIVDELKYVTGDQTLVYHGLRHAFANNTLLRLLIPEFPRLRCSQVDMFEDKHFSMKSCIQLRQRLLLGTQKDSRISVRDTLYQLAMFMGHASPETTIKNYLHLFDWITYRCLADDNFKLSDNTLRSILKLNNKHWFTLKKAFAGNVRNGSLNSDKVLEYVRKKHIGSFPNSIRSKVMKKGRVNKSVSYREMVPSDLIQLLPMLFQKKFTIEEGSERLNISPEDVIRIKDSAEALYQIKTRSGKARVPLVPSPLKGRQEHNDLNKMLSKFLTLSRNDKDVHAGLQQFVYGSPSTGMEVKLGTENEVKLYINFLRKLGMPKSRIILWYYPDPHSTKSERESVLQDWASMTGISTDHIFQKPLPRVKHSKNKRNRIGWISVFARKEKDIPDKSSGVQKALHYLAVFRGIQKR